MTNTSLRLTLVNPADNQPFELPEVPPDVTPAEIVTELVNQGHIPPLPAGQSYLLALKGGHQLDETQSLAANGVTDGATLQLIAPTPGASSESAVALVQDRPRLQVKRLDPVAPEPEVPPVPGLLYATREAASVRVYVSLQTMREVWQAVEARCYACGRSTSEARVERGGALVGRYAIDPVGQRFIVITGVIPATAAPASSTHITIRQEDWLAIHQRLAELPSVRLLGWYHSHPGLGVQMSSTDRDTQRRIFAADWQVGLVVDPSNHAFQFYVGATAEPVRWLAFIDETERAPLAQQNTAAESPVSQETTQAELLIPPAPIPEGRRSRFAAVRRVLLREMPRWLVVPAAALIGFFCGVLAVLHTL